MATREDSGEPSAGSACPDDGDDSGGDPGDGGNPARPLRAAHAPTGQLPPPTPIQRPRTERTVVTESWEGDRKRADNGGVARQRLPMQVARNAQPGTGGRASDPEFRDYVRARRHALLRTAYLLTGNAADAEDLVQSALAKTYLAWDRIADRGALDGYVRRALVNTHISWWRRRRVVEFPTDDLPDQAVADHAVNSDLQEAVRSAVDRLPQRMRAAVLLRFYDDMTEAEVAEVLGVSLGTVKSTVARAVAKLRIDADLLTD